MHCTSFVNPATFVTTHCYYEPKAPYSVLKVTRSDGRSSTPKQLAALQKRIHKGWGYKPAKEA